MAAACICSAAGSTGPQGAQRPSAARRVPSTPATPLPLLPFWQEFRSQVARLEGVRDLPMPPHLEASQCMSPAVGMRSGACQADRLRFGHFLYVNIGASTRTGPRGSLSLLAGALYPSCFIFHPPLAFEVAAFDGGKTWMVSVDYVPLPLHEEEGEARGEGGEREQERRQQHGQEWRQQGMQRGVQWQWEQEEQARDGSGASRGISTSGAAALSPRAWQQQLLQRLAAVRQLYRCAAVPLQAAPLSDLPAGAWLSPSCCLLSSAQLAATDPGASGAAARRAALDAVGLPAFRAALSVHLNGLAAAPAKVGPAHVARMAAAQGAHAASAAARPLLCTAQLAAAFGVGWLDELQEQLRAGSLRGLGEALAGHDATVQAAPPQAPGSPVASSNNSSGGGIGGSRIRIH